MCIRDRPYTLQAGTVQRSDQHKQQGVSYARRTSPNTGFEKQHIRSHIHVDPHMCADKTGTIFMKHQHPGGQSEITSLIDKINECVMNSKRGVIVRGLDPP